MCSPSSGSSRVMSPGAQDWEIPPKPKRSPLPAVSDALFQHSRDVHGTGAFVVHLRTGKHRGNNINVKLILRLKDAGVQNSPWSANCLTVCKCVQGKMAVLPLQIWVTTLHVSSLSAQPSPENTRYRRIVTYVDSRAYTS